MRAVVQRVQRANVSVDGLSVAAIGPGLLVLCGVSSSDTDADRDWLARKIVSLRVFDDDAGIMNRSLRDVGGELLAVSQFTLYASTRKGARPSYSAAAPPELAAGGFAHINHDNLCNWFKTGYVDWLRDQEHFEKLVLTTDAARIKKAPRTNRKNYRDFTDLDVAILLNNAAREFNLEKVREQLDKKPDSFFRLVQAHTMHERNAILRDRNEIEAKKLNAKKPKRIKPMKAGVTREELARITKRINL